MSLYSENFRHGWVDSELLETFEYEEPSHWRLY